MFWWIFLNPIFFRGCCNFLPESYIHRAIPAVKIIVKIKCDYRHREILKWLNSVSKGRVMVELISSKHNISSNTQRNTLKCILP